MSTLQIRKLQSGAFKHVDSIDGDFFLGRFNFKQEFNKAFLVEAYGAKRRQYSITEVEVFDFGGSAETFTNWTDLINRLVDLSYTGIDTNSIPSGGGVWGGISGTLSNQTDLQNALNSKQDVLTSTSFGTFSNSLTTDDTIPDAGIFNYTNVLGIQVKTTWANIKAKLASIFLTKVTTVDVEKVYIKNADGTQGMKPTSEFGGGATPKRSYFAEWKLGGAMAASTSWYQQAGLIGLRGIFTANAALTPANSFANCSVQTPSFVLPFQAKIKSVTVRGWCNGVPTATIRTCVVKSDNPNAIGAFTNPAIIADVSYLLNIPSTSCFANQFTGAGLTFTTLPALTQIRIFNFNNNAGGTPLQDTIISVEFEEVL